MANIFSQFMAPPKSVGEFGAEMQQAQGNKLALAFKRMQQQQAEQGMADDQAFRGLAQQYGNDPNALAKAAMGKGLYEQAQKVQGNIATAAKGKSDLDTAESARKKTELETALKRMEHGASILSTAKDPQSYAVALQTMEQSFPGSTQQMPQQFDPQDVAARLAAGQTIKDKIAGELSRSTLDQTIVRDTNSNNNAIAGNVIQRDSIASREREGAANRGVQYAGQQIQRDRLKFDQEQPKGVLDPERGLLVDPRTGEGRPITIGGNPVGKKMPAEVRKELMGISQQKAIILGALDAIEKTPSAFSFKRGLGGNLPFGETIAGRMEKPEETKARAYVFNNVSRVINERAGAAQSAQELARLNAFLPADTDGAQQIKNKFEGFLQYLGDMEKGTTGGYAEPANATPEDPLGLRN
jgi:hypothetical protein